MHDGQVTVFDRRPRLRWTVPIVAGAVIAGAVVAASGATADPGLPERSPAELLVALQEAQPTALSGTVSVATDLGLPELPASIGGGASGPTALLTGTHTLRVWTDGGSRSRVDLLGTSDEFDVIRNGSDVWAWSSATSEATHVTLPSEKPTEAFARPIDMTAMPSTPQEAADLVLSALDPTTAVTTTGNSTVAGRPVYELVLTPKQDGTRVGRVAISVDAETSVPLQVRVYSTQSTAPAIDVGFTSVDFATPADSVFAFTPPPGATVTEQDAATKRSGDEAGVAAMPEPTVVGEGWTTVAVLPGSPGGADVAAAGDATDQLAMVLETLPKVSGAWGSGRVLDGALVSVIVTDDGRVAVGAVTPKVLEAALAAR